MNQAPLYLLACLLLLCNGCITQVPNRTKHDYSKQYSTADFQALHPDIEFTVLDREDLDSLIATKPRVVFLLFATWCPPCYAQLIDGTYRHLAEKLAPAPFVPIFVNYNLEDWDKFYADQLPPRIYFLANPEQRSEVEQIERTRQQFCPTCDPLSGVPQYFWFEEGELVSTQRHHSFELAEKAQD